VSRHDPYVPAESEPLESALAGAEAVVIATNHSAYDRVLPQLPKSALLVDPWNVTGSAQVFAYADELVSAT
jgi:UDP-N-acetyl-D-mannosaminuronic acid dehydrogenase